MSQMKCPGQDARFFKAKDIVEVACPGCGHLVEFWPDELVRKCRACGRRFSNPKNSMKCLNWCRYAAQCLSAMQGGDMEPLREELLERMRRIFGDEQRKLDHTAAVLELAEEIGRRVGADPVVLIPAAILHDIDRAAAAEGAPRPQAAEVLADITLPDAVKREIVELVEHHHERDRMTSANGSALFDADLIVNLRDGGAPDRLGRLEAEALTDAGRRLGAERLAGAS
jgi:putative nucleotidyltransferase with HDIG domain